MLKTERLIIRIASDEEMRRLISEENDPELKKAYGEMLQGCIDCPEQRQWYAVWFIELPTGECIGDLCFKGLSDDGSVEIGYGLFPEYWGKGYATEAVKAVTAWAAAQTGVIKIEAETDAGNIASQKVLARCGFVPTGENGEEGPRFVRNIHTNIQ